MRTVTVTTDRTSCPVAIAAGALDQLPQMIRAHSGDRVRTALIADSTVARLYGPRTLALLDAAGISTTLITFPAGESSKTLDTSYRIISRLIEEKFTRDDLVLALGGGVTGDLAGFAAATCLRGIPCAQLPTTLLAQIDSAIGGKTGINHPLGKNLIGTFSQPAFVLIDPEVLVTLPADQVRSGMGEMIKYGLIADEALTGFLETNLEILTGLADPAVMEEAIHRCCQIKADIVRLDEKEKGPRRMLNFGHTLGHALETHLGFGTLTHGEAVVHGMHWAAWISLQRSLISRQEFSRIAALLQRLAVPPLSEVLDTAALTEAMTRDKKQSGRGLHWVLLERIGSTRIEPARDLEAYVKGWTAYVQQK